MQRFPLAWPEGWRRTPAGARKRAHFSKRIFYAANAVTGYQPSSLQELTVTQATKRVVDELGRMGVVDGDWIISTNIETRLDGLPRSGAREPQDPGVAVYWKARGQIRGRGRAQDNATRVMAIDLYDRAADNLAAIAATLEAMRAIERHGGAQILERAFMGFDALPAPKQWWEILEFRAPPAQSPEDNRATINARFRELASKHHPDMPGGSHDRMAEIARARDEGLQSVQDS